MNNLSYSRSIFDCFPIDCLQREHPQKKAPSPSSQPENSYQPVLTSQNKETAQFSDKICKICSAAKIADLWCKSQKDLCRNCIQNNKRFLRKKDSLGKICITCHSKKSHSWYVQKGTENYLCYKCHHTALGKICITCNTTRSSSWYKSKDKTSDICGICRQRKYRDLKSVEKTLLKKTFFDHICSTCYSTKSRDWYKQEGTINDLCYICYHKAIGNFCNTCSTTNSSHWYQLNDHNMKVCHLCYDAKKRKLA